MKNKDMTINSEDKLYAREELIYNVTEDLLVILEDLNISKKELSERLGTSKPYVTQVLSGSRNMTLGSFSDICFALGFKPQIKLPVQEEEIHNTESVSKANWSFVYSSNCSADSLLPVKNTLNVIDRRDPAHWRKVA